MKPVYFEDLVEGYVGESAEVIADRDDMVAYAERNDPYPIHVDEQFAATTPFGGLVASFGYTVSLYLRMIHDTELARGTESTMLGALEWRVTFRGPIRPGDRLHVRETISSKRLASTGNRGVVTSRNHVLNQHDESPINRCRLAYRHAAEPLLTAAGSVTRRALPLGVTYRRVRSLTTIGAQAEHARRMVALAGAGGRHREVAMRKIVLVLGALALSVGVTASPAWSAEGGTDRPVKATFSFTLSGVTGQGSGSTIGSHTGLSDVQVQLTSATTGTVVVTAANGDQIFQTFSNDSATSGVITYTGGTGRFADVTGQAQSTFVVTPTSDPTVVQVTGSLEGTISY